MPKVHYSVKSFAHLDTLWELWKWHFSNIVNLRLLGLLKVRGTKPAWVTNNVSVNFRFQNCLFTPLQDGNANGKMNSIHNLEVKLWNPMLRQGVSGSRRLICKLKCLQRKEHCARVRKLLALLLWVLQSAVKPRAQPAPPCNPWGRRAYPDLWVSVRIGGIL